MEKSPTLLVAHDINEQGDPYQATSAVTSTEGSPNMVALYDNRGVCGTCSKQNHLFIL